MSAASDAIEIELDGRDVRITNPAKVFFPESPAGPLTKLDLVQYYLAVAPGALVGCRDRPNMLHRYPDGADGEEIYQKRVPSHRPPWIQTTTVRFPSGRSAEFLAIQDAAHLAWAINLGCLDLNPWPVRCADARQVALVVKEVLEEHGLTGFPKTSGKRGIHVNVRVEPRWDFTEVRRAALALARAVERRAPDIATSAWWKEERHGVFIDYNQNAKDRTTVSAYSVRPTADARVSAPLSWDEVDEADPEDFTLGTMPKRFAKIGDRHAGMEESAGSLEGLLELSARQEKEGQGDAPWPPHYRKQPGEPPRVQPSKARTGARVSKYPLIEVSRGKDKKEALAGLSKWKKRYPRVAKLLEPADVLVDQMRGRSSAWYRIRINLQHVPEKLRPRTPSPARKRV